MLKKIMGLWLVFEVVLPFLVFYFVISGNRSDVSEYLPRKISELCVVFRNFPKIEFSGIENSAFSEIIGLVTWWMGVISIPIFLVPIVRKLINEGRSATIRVDMNNKEGNRTSRDRLKHRAFLVMLIICSCYYVLLGYFSPGPIKLHSAAGAAAMVLGISFGPAAIILLSCALVIDFIAAAPTLNQGASDE